MLSFDPRRTDSLSRCLDYVLTKFQFTFCFYVRGSNAIFSFHTVASVFWLKDVSNGPDLVFGFQFDLSFIFNIRLRVALTFYG